MTRLDFTLPEFTRIIWATERARDVWQPRLEKVNKAWTQLERASVINGLRPGGLQSVAPEDLYELMKRFRKTQTDFTIVAEEGAVPIYGNASQPVIPGQPWTYRVYFGEAPNKFLEYWEEGNEVRIGQCLGYPVCCSKFFLRHWKGEGWRDLTYPMAGLKNGEVKGSYLCNSLLRHLGVRSVFHLPCSFDCDSTVHLGASFLSLGHELGYVDEMDWIREMLNWPVQWSSLHGVAIITTPAVKIITSTDAIPMKGVLNRPGECYPQEGATGTEFPFQDVQPLRLVNDWDDNGFANREAQRSAHDMILRTLDDVSFYHGMVIDLGSGNGLLLAKITHQHTSLQALGVELAQEKVLRSKAPAILGNIYDVDRYKSENVELVLVSLNRFTELDEGQGLAFLKELSRFTHHLLVYSYDEWIPAYNTIFTEYFSLEKNDGNTRFYTSKVSRSPNEQQTT